MAFSALSASIWTQFATALGAPVPFLAAVIAVAVMIRWYFHNSYETRLSNSESTVKMLERQLQEYRDKTGSETPDAVRTHIEALKQRISELDQRFIAIGPRKVSSDQRQQMVPFLDQFRGSLIQISSDAASADAAQMSKGLIAAFQSAGWHALTPMIMGLGSPPPSGVGLRVGDPNNLSPAQEAVVRALRAAKIGFDFQHGELGPAFATRPGQLERPTPIAEIILTTRLED